VLESGTLGAQGGSPEGDGLGVPGPAQVAESMALGEAQVTPSPLQPGPAE
jgi:hypothetical protein